MSGLAAVFPGIADQGIVVFGFVFFVSVFGFGYQAFAARKTLSADASLSPFFSAITYWNILAMAFVLTPLTFIGVLPLPSFLSAILPIPSTGPTIFDYPPPAVATLTWMFLVFAVHSVSNICRPLYHAFGSEVALQAAPYAAAYPLLLLVPIAAGTTIPFMLFVMIFSEIGQHMLGAGWWFLQYRKTSNEAYYYGILSVLLHLTSVLPWLGYMIFSGDSKSGFILFLAHGFMMTCMFASQHCLVETARRTKADGSSKSMY